MHEQGVIHRTLNPGNLMISDRMEVKIGDFGCAERLTSERPRRYSMVGNAEYMAPEIIDRNLDDGHGYECDIWNLGVIVYNLLMGELPFDGANNRDIFDRILSLDYTFDSEEDHPRPEISADAKQFIELCLQINPKDRPSLQDLLWHPFINGRIILPKYLDSRLLYQFPSDQYIAELEQDVNPNYGKNADEIQKALLAKSLKGRMAKQ